MRYLVPLVLASSISLAAQSPEPSPEPIQISPNEALAHRIGHDKPAYPHFALAAGVSGTVKVILTIAPDGAIQQESTLIGPPSLIASAQAWISSSKFRPFLRDGRPVSVTTMLPAVFALPPGAHSAHPLRALYPKNITATIDREGRDSPQRARWSMLSSAMRDWLARYQAAVANISTLLPAKSLESVLAVEGNVPPLTHIPGNIALYPVPLTVPHHHLYLLFEFSHGCAKSDCPIFLIGETPAGARLLFGQLGVDVDVHRRHDSPYPDLLFWSDSLRPDQPGISNISGFSYYGSQWDQLYCGTDDANEDALRDEEIAEHHGAVIPQPPLVTLCK